MGMFDDPGILGQMEEHGYMDTNEGLIGRVAEILKQSPNAVIGNDEFIDACYKAGVNPYLFTEDDMASLQRKLD